MLNVARRSLANGWPSSCFSPCSQIQRHAVSLCVQHSLGSIHSFPLFLRLPLKCFSFPPFFFASNLLLQKNILLSKVSHYRCFQKKKFSREKKSAHEIRICFQNLLSTRAGVEKCSNTTRPEFAKHTLYGLHFRNFGRDFPGLVGP